MKKCKNVFAHTGCPVDRHLLNVRSVLGLHCRSPFVLISILQLAYDVGEQCPPGFGDVGRKRLAQLLLPDVDDGSSEHVEVVGQEAFDGDVPPSELVERRRAVGTDAKMVDRVDDEDDHLHETVRLKDELRMTDQLIAPRVVERIHSFHRRPVLEDAQEHLRETDSVN